MFCDNSTAVSYRCLDEEEEQPEGPATGEEGWQTRDAEANTEPLR